MYLRRIDKTAATEVGFSHATILFSYSTPVAARWKGNYYRTSFKHSPTTTRHINRWILACRLGIHQSGKCSREAREKPQEWFDGLVDVVHREKADD